MFEAHRHDSGSPQAHLPDGRVIDPSEYHSTAGDPPPRDGGCGGILIRLMPALYLDLYGEEIFDGVDNITRLKVGLPIES